MPALHALFYLRLWVFGLIFSRGKVLYMRVLFFFVGNIFGDREKQYFCKWNGGAKWGCGKRKRRSIAAFGGVR